MCSSSVGPTVSVSMLNPRRAKRAAMRVSTPGLFSTRMVRTCLGPDLIWPLASRSSRESSSLVPGSPMTSAHHLARGGAGRDHRVHVLLAGDADVHDHRPLRRDRRAEVVD